MPSRNLAQRAARWSARHRRIAIFGWLALVVVCLGLAGNVGLQEIKDEDSGNGESRRADQALADAGFADRASEQVLVQSEDGSLQISDPRFTAGVRDVVRRLRVTPNVVDVQSPWRPRTRGRSRATGAPPW